MNKRALLVCLAALAFGGAAEAAPINFFNTQFEVTAIAAGDGAPGFETQSGPPTATPLSASASSGTVDIATAGAIAGPGLLTTSADVAGGGGIANSVATSHFAGSFLNLGPVSLSIDFLALDLASGSADAVTTLFVWLTSGGVTLFQDFVTGPWVFEYSPLAGTTSVLDLTLSSQSSAGFPNAGVGNGAAFGLASFTGSVPEAPTALLLALSLGVMVVVRQGRR